VRRLSLRTWILLPSWALVTGLILILSVSEADTLTVAWLKSSREIAELAGQQVKQTLLRRLGESTPQNPTSAQSLEASKLRWAGFIQTDPGISSVLEGMAGRGGAIVEISITDRSGRVLVSSDRGRAGRPAMRREPLSSLENLSTLSRIRVLFSPAKDYAYSIPIGLQGELQPLFTIHVLVSNVLLRDAVRPGLKRILMIAAAALILSLILVYAVAAFTTSNLNRIGAIIDSIGGDQATRDGPATGGRPGRNSDVAFPAAEFDAVGSKLSLLDSRVRDALYDANQYRNRVNSMLDGLQEAIVLFDEDRVVLATGPAAPLLGCGSEQLAGRPRKEVLPPGTTLGNVVERAFAERRRLRGQAVTGKNGDHDRQLIVNLDFIQSASAPTQRTALLRVRDAGGAGEVESQLQLSSRLEAINRLTGGVAHEIKNPLNAISARLALLESIVADDMPDAENQIRIIAGEIERLDRVVRTFLDFTRPLEIARETLNFGELAREVAHSLEPDAKRRGTTITFEITGGASLEICGDRDLLKQAIINIAVNGLEAMADGGVLRMRAQELAGSAQLSISDTGPGIPEAQAAEIFKLYYTTKKGGSGIGLAVAYRTLQLHGGVLSVESEAGKGSTFHLVMPMVRVEETVENSTHGIAAGAGTPV
jgi:signal transduction histidine kinase